MVTEFIILLIALVFIAFFSGIEIAFVSANKLRVELLKEKSGSARIVSDFNHNPSRFISTMLIGLNITLVIFASMMAKIITPGNFEFLPHDEAWLMIIETLVTTVVVLLLGELIPKMLFRINADRMLLLFAYPTYGIYLLLMPFTNIFHWLSKRILKTVIGKDYNEGRQNFTEEDLEYLVKETAAQEEKEENETDDLNSELFERALYLKEVKVKNCMVPRTEIEAIEADESVEELRRKFFETKHSRIIVYDDTIDKVIGYVHHFDLLKKPVSIRQFIRPVEVVPVSMNAQSLLIQLVKERKNMAWVVDEYGGTAGLITLEDLMEEIFGEIEDEHDENEETEKKISDDRYLFSARLEVDYLNKKYQLNIPEGEYETLSGYIVMNNQDIPEQGETVFLDNFEIKIQKATDKRIEMVYLKINPVES
ncbi:MAG: hemolysin family protein [Chitinophagales bacterium]